MSSKTMRETFIVSAFAALTALATTGCGDDKEKPADDAPDDGGSSAPENEGGTASPSKRTWSGTLVQILAQDTNAPITIRHKIIVLDNKTGEPLEGGKYTAMTSATDGTWEIKDVPMDKPIAFQSEGQGAATDMNATYDSIVINVTADTAPDPLSRISSASTASVANTSAGFTTMEDMSSLTGAVYYVKNGMRVSVVGCTQVWLDDDPAQPPTKGDLRYVGSNGLPVPIATQGKTEGTRGAFLFANLAVGTHKLKFSVDGGKTFFGETEIYITKARKDSASALKGGYKGILYQIGIDIGEDKTPADCK